MYWQREPPGVQLRHDRVQGVTDPVRIPGRIRATTPRRAREPSAGGPWNSNGIPAICCAFICTHRFDTHTCSVSCGVPYHGVP